MSSGLLACAALHGSFKDSAAPPVAVVPSLRGLRSRW